MEDLIRRARGGDEGALEELFRRCRPALDAWATRRLPKGRLGAVRPSDIAQEAALRAFRKFASFHGQTEAEWLAWLQTVIRNCALQAGRDAGRIKRDEHDILPLDSPEASEASALDPSPSEETALKEQWREILAQMFHLPGDQREAVKLYYLKDSPVSEVARAMGKTPAAVAGLLRRGLDALRSRVANGVPVEAAERPMGAGAEEATAAFLDYLRRRDAGERVDRDAFVAEHASCANELRGMLEWSERLRSMWSASSAR